MSDADNQDGSPRDLLDFMVRELVDDPDSVSIEEFDEGGRIEFQVTTAPNDVGRVIGRRGHVIQSIRTLVRAAASRDGLDADVEIID
jgi:predicted RNA-binding protein YlqC (UPF0109 family)